MFRSLKDAMLTVLPSRYERATNPRTEATTMLCFKELKINIQPASTQSDTLRGFFSVSKLSCHDMSRVHFLFDIGNTNYFRK